MVGCNECDLDQLETHTYYCKAREGVAQTVGCRRGVCGRPPLDRPQRRTRGFCMQLPWSGRSAERMQETRVGLHRRSAFDTVLWVNQRELSLPRLRGTPPCPSPYPVLHKVASTKHIIFSQRPFSFLRESRRPSKTAVELAISASLAPLLPETTPNFCLKTTSKNLLPIPL